MQKKFLFLQVFLFVTHRAVQWRSQGHCFGGQVASGEGILGGSAPNFYMELDFSNGLEHNWGGGTLTMPLELW